MPKKVSKKTLLSQPWLKLTGLSHWGVDTASHHISFVLSFATSQPRGSLPVRPSAKTIHMRIIDCDCLLQWSFISPVMSKSGPYCRFCDDIHARTQTNLFFDALFFLIPASGNSSILLNRLAAQPQVLPSLLQRPHAYSRPQLLALVLIFIYCQFLDKHHAPARLRRSEDLT